MWQPQQRMTAQTTHEYIVFCVLVTLLFFRELLLLTLETLWYITSSEGFKDEACRRQKSHQRHSI